MRLRFSALAIMPATFCPLIFLSHGAHAGTLQNLSPVSAPNRCSPNRAIVRGRTAARGSPHRAGDDVVRVEFLDCAFSSMERVVAKRKRSVKAKKTRAAVQSESGFGIFHVQSIANYRQITFAKSPMAIAIQWTTGSPELNVYRSARTPTNADLVVTLKHDDMRFAIVEVDPPEQLWLEGGATAWVAPFR